MCLVVNYDLVIPAVLNQEFALIKSLDGYKENKDSYLRTMSICARQVTNYAIRMLSWDLGRVVINFDSKDVLHFLQYHPDLFEPLDFGFKYDERSVFMLKIPDRVPKDFDLEEYVSNFIDELSNPINYCKRVLRTVGLLYDTKEEIEIEKGIVAQENCQSEGGPRMVKKSSINFDF